MEGGQHVHKKWLNFYILPTFPSEYLVRLPEKEGDISKKEGGQHVSVDLACG